MNSAEFLWLCCGIRPLLLPDPVDSAQPQAQPHPRPLVNGGAAITWAAIPERESPAR
jgi:hypothetical protein